MAAEAATPAFNPTSNATFMFEPAVKIAAEQCLPPAELAQLQRQKLGAMLAEVREHNPFYRAKMAGIAFDPLRDPISALPFTLRHEIEADQLAHPPFGTILTYPVEQYSRYHQTSGTGGRPVRWLDTPQSWAWFEKCWTVIFQAGGVHSADRVCFPFSFGPFIGFWGAFAAANRLGCLCLPAGGLTTSARLRMILDNQVDVVCCTPTYALHMAQVAAEEKLDIAGSRMRAFFVAGEPGGSIPAVRSQIERAWNARVYDHSGMTEMGALSFECQPNPGELHVIESEFIAECIDPDTLAPVADGDVGELVLTNLGRIGSPLIRYRTRDLVRIVRGTCQCGRTFARLLGGILGRVDDMLIVRGNNVYPTAVEAVLRRFVEIAEFRVTIAEKGSLWQVHIEIEPVAQCADAQLPEKVAKAMQETLNFRVPVSRVPAGTLPRFEMKSRRFVRIRDANTGS